MYMYSFGKCLTQSRPSTFQKLLRVLLQSRLLWQRSYPALSRDLSQLPTLLFFQFFTKRRRLKNAAAVLAHTRWPRCALVFRVVQKNNQQRHERRRDHVPVGVERCPSLGCQAHRCESRYRLAELVTAVPYEILRTAVNGEGPQ